MLFYKVLILFWGCTRTCSHARWFENRIIFHIIYIITIILSSWPETNDSIISRFDEGLPKNEMCCDWLAVLVRCDWRTA